jgi:hypothetical protein
MKDEMQTSADVLMIRPLRFQGNPQTASSNRFQQASGCDEPRTAQGLALVEFDSLVASLRQAGVTVHVFEDTHEPHTPDSVFPNNWVTFHADGTAVLYPMLAQNRRDERRLDILEALSARGNFRISRVIDLTDHELDHKFLEGTGSLVLDRVNRLAYACISPRTDLDVLGDFAQRLDYDIVSFEANDKNGAPIYHTNVLMSVATRFAAVCSESIREDARASVVESLEKTGHQVLELSFAQMTAFAGNMLELRTSTGSSVVAMSNGAYQSLSGVQREFIKSHSGGILAVPIPTIETLGGGSVRCMLAEVALPRKEVAK